MCRLESRLCQVKNTWANDASFAKQQMTRHCDSRPCFLLPFMGAVAASRRPLCFLMTRCWPFSLSLQRPCIYCKVWLTAGASHQPCTQGWRGLFWPVGWQAENSTCLSSYPMHRYSFRVSHRTRRPVRCSSSQSHCLSLHALGGARDAGFDLQSAHLALPSSRLLYAPCTTHHAPCTMHHAPRTMLHAPCAVSRCPAPRTVCHAPLARNIEH